MSLSIVWSTNILADTGRYWQGISLPLLVQCQDRRIRGIRDAPSIVISTRQPLGMFLCQTICIYIYILYTYYIHIYMYSIYIICIYTYYIYMWNHQPAMAAMLRRAVDFFDQATWNSSGNQLEPLRPQPAFLNSQVSCWLCYPCCFDSTWLTNNSHFLDLVTKIQWVVFCQVFSCFFVDNVWWLIRTLV
jgi:hypothetical protein